MRRRASGLQLGEADRRAAPTAIRFGECAGEHTLGRRLEVAGVHDVVLLELRACVELQVAVGVHLHN